MPLTKHKNLGDGTNCVLKIDVEYGEFTLGALLVSPDSEVCSQGTEIMNIRTSRENMVVQGIATDDFCLNDEVQREEHDECESGKQ